MDPLVDVNIAVYNHAPYLKQTLNSVLEQKTNFPFRLLIGDDCSTDGSIEILKEFEKKYSDKITVIYQPQNLGLNSPERNGIILLKNSTAKYIALLDGDDYWCDENKLQKQVDFLESNSDYSICFHRAYELLPEGKPELYQGSSREETYSIEDLAHGNIIITASVLFRNYFFKDFPAWYASSPVGDYGLHLLNARHGKIKYFPEPMAVYRRGAGIWSTQNSDFNYIRLVKLIDLLLQEFPEKQIQKNLTLQKLKYLKWIKDWPADFNPLLQREEVIEFINESNKADQEFANFLNDPSKIASNISLKTLMRSLIKKLSNKTVHTS